MYRRCRRIAGSLVSQARSWGYTLPKLTEFRAFRGTAKSTARVLQFSVGLGMPSDLQQAAPDGDGDRMGPVVGLKFIHQVLDVEINGCLRN